jgi:hypothetical protein
MTSKKGVRPSSRSIRCIWQEILNFEFFNFTCVFFHKWITEGSNPGVNFFQNFHFEDTSELVTSRKSVRPSFRSIRCIWHERLDVEYFNFTCIFLKKVGVQIPGSPFLKLLPSGSLSIPNTTGESPNGMGGTVLHLGASGHWLDYVIDTLPLCLGLLGHYLGTNWEQSSSRQG